MLLWLPITIFIPHLFTLEASPFRLRCRHFLAFSSSTCLQSFHSRLVKYLTSISSFLARYFQCCPVIDLVRMQDVCQTWTKHRAEQPIDEKAKDAILLHLWQEDKMRTHNLHECPMWRKSNPHSKVQWVPLRVVLPRLHHPLGLLFLAYSLGHAKGAH